MKGSSDLNNAATRKKNHSEHIKWLTGMVKMLRADLDACKVEVDRMRKRTEARDSE